MAIKKSTYTGGMGRPMLHSPYVANVAAETIIAHTFTEAVAATDILELAYLPANCKILACEVLSVGTAAVTVNVGFMSGKVGSDDAARTLGTELVAAGLPTTKLDVAIDKLAALAASTEDRSIGIQPSGAIAASASTKIFVRIRYAKGVN